MIRIVYTMDNGDKYYRSKCSFKEGAPYDAISAKIDLENSLEKLVWFKADDDTVVVCSHISSAKIENIDPAAPPEPPCQTCGTPGRWIPESNAWGCDRCRELIVLSAPPRT